MSHNAVLTGEHFVQGDWAIAEGAIAAGCRYFAGYPITPASEIEERLAERLPEVGGVLVQMEDELGSIHSIGGASLAGLKAMTASAGPGISLKLEGLGWGIKNEIPYVVIDIQRAGPSNGVATNIGMGDLYTLRYGSAGGNYELIALTPKSVQEAFDLTIEAFNLSETFRCPVILLSDATIGHMRERLAIPKAEEIEVIPRRKPEVSPEEFILYPFDNPSKINHPFPAIGEGYGVCASPYTHTEKGYETGAVDAQARMAIRLVNKIRKNLEMLTKVETKYLEEDLDYAIVVIGSEARPASSAIEKARKKGIKVGMVRPIIVWPFPDKQVYQVAKKVKGIIVPEINLDGQLAREVTRASKGEAEVFHLGHAGVETHTVEDIYQKIRGVSNEY